MVILIQPAEFPRDLAPVRELLREYAAGLGFDLSFQDFAGELADLPGKYAPPAGRFLLARQGRAIVGCVALRAVDGAICEMKRLYVQPAARGERLGRRLAERICDEARAAGYRRIVLDTLPQMRAALALYRGLGFAPVAPYIFNPFPDAQFLARDL